MGIVLPEGILNNPSLRYVREFVEDRAFIRAVVSLPQEAFVSSGASVKASLLFLQKFTEEEKQKFEEIYQSAKIELIDKKQDEDPRPLLKRRFDYFIFMCDAEKIGITATGEDDQNELFPNDNQPDNIEKTCLELYRQFLKNPKSFLFNGEYI